MTSPVFSACIAMYKVQVPNSKSRNAKTEQQICFGKRGFTKGNLPGKGCQQCLLKSIKQFLKRIDYRNKRRLRTLIFAGKAIIGDLGVNNPNLYPYIQRVKN